MLWIGLAAAVCARLPLLACPDGQLGFAEHIALLKAWSFWNWGRPGLDLNPHTAGWPGLSFYLAFAAQAVARAAGTLAGEFRRPGDFEAAFILHPGEVILATQIFWTAILLAALAAAYAWARRAAGRPAAALALLGLALDPLLLESSLTATPDVPAMALLWLALALFSSPAAARGPRMPALAAFLCGLGAAAKYYPALGLLAATPLLAHEWPRGPARAWRLGLTLVAACAVGFALGSPASILDWSTTRRDLDTQLTALAGGHFGQAWTGPAWLYYGVRALPEDAGWPVCLAGLAGLLWLLARRPGSRPAAAAVLAVMAAFGAAGAVYPRYVLPALPLLWTGAGWCAASTVRRVRPRPAGVALVAAAAAAWIVLVPMPRMRGWLRPETVAVAARELSAWRPFPRALLREVQTPLLPGPREVARLRALAAAGELSPRWKDQALRLVPSISVTLSMSTIHPELRDLYYDPRYLEAVDGVLLSGGVFARYEAEPRRFPRQVEFYRVLRRHARLARRWGGPGFSGPTLEFYLPDSSRFGALEADWAGAVRGFPPPRLAAETADDAAFHTEMGRLFLARGRRGPARSELELALRLEPGRVETLEVLRSLGRSDAAGALSGRGAVAGPGF